VNDNEKWNRAIEGFERIITDPNETPARRRKAQAAWDAAVRPSHSHGGIIPAGERAQTGHSGGDSLHADAVYEGWGDR
jgi:hypothetical protein